MTNAVPFISKPAIYNYDLSEYEPLEITDAKGQKIEKYPSHWGWHRASELLEAINHTLHSKNIEVMGPREVAANFTHLSPYLQGDLLAVTGNGDPWIIKGNSDDWLEIVLSEDGYLPAGIGTQILQEIGDPKYVCKNAKI